MTSHVDQQKNFPCTVCKKDLKGKSVLESQKHSDHKTRPELNCNDCQLQAITGPELKSVLMLKSINQPMVFKKIF